MSFATKHGMWLQEFTRRRYLNDSREYLKEFLPMCPNIKKIDLGGIPNLSMFIQSGSLRKLEGIKTIPIEAYDPNKLEPLVRKYEKRLKELRISIIEELASDELMTCFAHISRFESLESLEIRCVFRTSDDSIIDCLQVLAKKCIKLRKLKFSIDSIDKSDRLLLALSEFRSLESLDIETVVNSKEVLNVLNNALDSNICRLLTGS